MKPLTLGKRVTLTVPMMHVPIIVAVAVSCFLANPFDEGNDLNGIGLFMWWFMIVVISYACGEGVAQNVFLRLIRQHRTIMAFGIGPITGAAAVTAGNTLFILAVTSALGTPARLSATLMSIFPMACVVAVTRYSFLFLEETMRSQKAQETPDRQDATTAPAIPPAPEPEILKRLPAYLGNDLLYFRSHDHYVEFTTSEGTHFELLRFRDALDEAATLDGVQIRRGCWVSVPAIQSSATVGKKLIITTRDGEKHIASKTYKSQIKDRLRLR